MRQLARLAGGGHTRFGSAARLSPWSCPCRCCWLLTTSTGTIDAAFSSCRYAFELHRPCRCTRTTQALSMEVGLTCATMVETASRARKVKLLVGDVQGQRLTSYQAVPCSLCMRLGQAALAMSQFRMPDVLQLAVASVGSACYCYSQTHPAVVKRAR